MDVLLWLINLLLQWYVWLPIVLLLVYMTMRNYRRIDAIKAIESTLLVLEIPKANDKSELAAEQLFASLHGILRDRNELKYTGGVQEHLSFEIASVNGQIRFYVWVPKTFQSFVEGQIYSQYPSVQIHEADEDYVTHERQHSVVYTSELTLTSSEYLPIKTFQSFEVDPLAGITGTLAKLEATGDELWVQILVRPIADEWHKDSDSWIKTVKSGNPFSFLTGDGFNFKWVGGLFSALSKPPEQGIGGGAAPKELSERDKTRITEAEKKATKLGYQVKIRVAYLGESPTNAKLRMQALVGTYKQYNSTNLNGFKMTNSSFRKEDLAQYKARLFADRGFILNIEELASVFHLPHTNVETPNIVWASTKTAEPPAKLPIITGNDAIDENISAFGLTNFRGINHQFGMLRYDRSRHVYIIGQTGAGKSGTLELFALSDIFHGQGYAIIDPHGDFAVDNMRFIPGSRIQDVVYFNPSDTAYPLGFNPLEVTNPNQKSNISSEVIGVLKRMFGDSWGPRLEYILRYTILALLDRPETTMLDITRMLTDKKFRKETLSYCTDTVVLQFWNIEFNSWTEKFQAEAIAPVLNKVGAFTANPVIRNIIGQPKSTFNIRQIMDEGKILIVNLSKGLIGEDNASILGSFLVTKIQLAAMSRSDIPDIKDRRPFFLYVDEFQNFATDSFATILSEARKYGLNLTVANQYISQMSDTVRNAVFGNVGTIISFRVSADDAPILAKQFEPQFEANDLLQMHNRHFIINMVIKGEKTPAFSATTLTLPPPQIDNTGRIIEHTRITYSRRREDVEAEIAAAVNPPKPAAANQPAAPKSQPTNPTALTMDGATPEQSTDAETATPTPQVLSSIESDAPVKKKRKRTRKRKSSSGTASVPGEGSTRPVSEATTEASKPEPKPKEDGTVLRLR
ncbi:type IV secretion system DNA-binding domain-containing protein [Streptomyces caniscabiei]|uniref:type IV secretory system conjugative DNA transfer family protein n=1 Tax=Streptomyces caniscabiei TaxID=2746961 RepID=UPI0029B77404|nr:type IV secretion system DNA-binding domain-containing protein [Streptomyces caniscabiei]MDX2776161.1 type IV secretion system DNA-binding domain-containing protein [Streptomyces caniscabiei]